MNNHHTLGGAAYPHETGMDGHETRNPTGSDIAIADKAQVAADRVSVLVEAQGLVHGDRNDAYGHPLDDWSRTAAMVSAMLDRKLKEPLTAEDCALILCCVKISRQQNAPKRDNLTDLAGYAECVQWMIDERARRG